jgi:ATP-dependent helicase/nuclease subunit A
MNPAYFHNGQPVSAEAFYAIACDPRRNVAVEACAGAGKTWMLVSRVLRALLEGGEGTGADGKAADILPHEVLAITFTKKAAGEMRERLHEWLEKFAHADDATLRQELVIRGVTSQARPDASPLPRERLSTLYQKILASGRPVQIRTFHSWFAALLRSAPLEALQQLGLPLNYDLLEDDGPAKALVWRRFYAALADDAPARADFETVVQMHGRFQADKALQGALDKRTEFMLADAQGVVDASVRAFGEQFPLFAGLAHPDQLLDAEPVHRALFLQAAQALGRASAPTFSAKGVELEQAVSNADVGAMLAALLTDKGTARKFGDKLAGIATVRDAQDLALAMADARAQHEAWDYQQRMARLSRLLLAEYTSLKRERSWVDMNDVERAALVMLGDPVLAGWVQERLDARVRHLLIDEFQDTNPLQWQALSSWLSSYGGAGRAPSVFIVGDPKQSIYRFRRAEPQVFIAAQAFVQTVLDGDLLACDHTRRNSRAVMATVNAVMGNARDNDGYTDFRTHTSASADAGRVVRLPAIPRNTAGARLDSDAAEPTAWRDSLVTPRELPEDTLRSLEARQAAAWVAAQVAAGLKPRDVMALSRKRACLMPLQDELRACGVAAQIGEKTSLIDCCEVQDIVALFDVLVSPQHDLSMARVLRSPLFGVDSQSLVELALLKAATGEAWFDLLQNKELGSPGLIGLGPVLMQYKTWVDRLPPHDALQAIYQHGDVLARFAAAAPPASRSAVLSNLNALPGAALQLDGGRYATPYAFVRALKAGGLLAPAALNPDAVRLLTVHGAKGLEAQAVLILDADTPERAADSMSVLIEWPGEAAAPTRFVFLVSESRPPACALDALELERRARAREELNALYVALTRACNTLAISSIVPHRPTTSSWWQRLYTLAQPGMHEAGGHAEAAEPRAQAASIFEPGKAAKAAKADDFFVLPDLPPLARRESPGVVVAFPADASASVEVSAPAVLGRAMHRLLEWGAGAADWADDRRARAVRAVQREFDLSPEQAADAAAAASRIQRGEAAWAWDSSVIDWQGNEVELVYGGQTRRLDRLVRRKDAGHVGQWWVLDYKSPGRPQDKPELVAQIQAYRDALRAIYPGDDIRAAFLTAQGSLVEVV